MKIALGVVLTGVALMLGSTIWGIARARRHFYEVLVNRDELKRVVDHFGRERIVSDSRSIAPVLGTFERNIELLEQAHWDSLGRTVNILAVVNIAVLLGSAYAGFPFFLAVICCSFGPFFLKIPSAAKNANLSHFYTVFLNIAKYHAVTPSECKQYCLKKRPEFMVAHYLLTSRMSAT